VGIKTTLGKANNLSIVILWFDYLTPTKVILNPSKKRLINITSSLLRLIMEEPLFHHSALNWNCSSTLKPSSWMVTGIDIAWRINFY